MKTLIVLALLVSVSVVCFAQMTVDQKVADFQQLAAVYAKNYGPYEWKISSQGFDLLNLKPWLDRVRQSSRLLKNSLQALVSKTKACRIVLCEAKTLNKR